jgi:hypothetical protein
MADNSILHIGWLTLFDEKICKSAAHAVLQIYLSDPKIIQILKKYFKAYSRL